MVETAQLSSSLSSWQCVFHQQNLDKHSGCEVVLSAGVRWFPLLLGAGKDSANVRLAQ